MKKITLALAVALGLAACNKETTTAVPALTLKTKKDSLNYSIGRVMAQNTVQTFAGMEIELDSLDKEVFLSSFIATVKEDSILLPEAEVKKIIQAFSAEMQAKQQAKQQAEQAELQAKMASYATTVEAFTAGTVGEKKMTASGLQYAVIKEGTGAKPTAQSKVMVHYHGMLPNGDVFDSSAERGQPTSFGLNQVIPGWTEGLQLMSVGSKYKLYIPSNLAYGERGSGPKIGPNQDIEFIVELLEIVK